MSEIPKDIFETACGIVMEAKSLKSQLRHRDVVDAIASALAAERERCASIAEAYSAMSHTAHDIKSKSFPTKSPVELFIAKQIRGEG